MLNNWNNYSLTARLKKANLELLADVFFAEKTGAIVATLHDENGCDFFEELTPDQLDVLADSLKELASSMRKGEIEISLGLEKTEP